MIWIVELNQVVYCIWYQTAIDQACLKTPIENKQTYITKHMVKLSGQTFRFSKFRTFFSTRARAWLRLDSGGGEGAAAERPEPPFSASFAHNDGIISPCGWTAQQGLNLGFQLIKTDQTPRQCQLILPTKKIFFTNILNVIKITIYIWNIKGEYNLIYFFFQGRKLKCWLVDCFFSWKDDSTIKYAINEGVMADNKSICLKSEFQQDYYCLLVYLAK